jgi:uncharacterized protein YqeY
MPVIDDLRLPLRARLRSAMRERDHAVGALRSAIAALDNAEAIEVREERESRPPSTSLHVAGARSGLGAGEAHRRVLTAQEQRAVLENEIASRRATADDLDRGGRHEIATRLRTEAEILATVLDAPDAAPPP